MIKKHEQEQKQENNHEKTGPNVSKMIGKPTGDYYGYWGNENGDHGGNIFWPTNYMTTIKRHWDADTQTIS
ncbi:hypothetical protein KA089_00510 [Candidatus Woesebacteria bacterium]|nr:hypothetical protein [Candidatus Woesebacteria bacterium]